MKRVLIKHNNKQKQKSKQMYRRVATNSQKMQDFACKSSANHVKASTEHSLFVIYAVVVRAFVKNILETVGDAYGTVVHSNYL